MSYQCVCVLDIKNISSGFSSNSEANASELLGNLEEMSSDLLVFSKEVSNIQPHNRKRTLSFP